jgi:hypothetical protein
MCFGRNLVQNILQIEKTERRPLICPPFLQKYILYEAEPEEHERKAAFTIRGEKESPVSASVCALKRVGVVDLKH